VATYPTRTTATTSTAAVIFEAQDGETPQCTRILLSSAPRSCSPRGRTSAKPIHPKVVMTCVAPVDATHVDAAAGEIGEIDRRDSRETRSDGDDTARRNAQLLAAAGRHTGRRCARVVLMRVGAVHVLPAVDAAGAHVELLRAHLDDDALRLRLSNSNIARLANTANIGILVALPPSSVAVDRFGARVPTVACACAMVACTLLRLLPPLVTLGDGAILWLNVASIAFNGAAAA